MAGFRLGLPLFTACLLMLGGCLDGGDGEPAEGSGSDGAGDGAQEDGDPGSSGSAGSGSGASGGVTGSPGSSSGGDSGGSSGGSGSSPGFSDLIDSGLSPDQNLSDLSESEAFELCERFNEQTGSLLSDGQLAEVACVSAGAIAGMDFADPSAPFDVSACEAAVADCVEQGEGESVMDPMCEGAAMDLAGCDITAGQLEACYNALFASVVEVFELLTCEAFSDPETLTMLQSGPDFGNPPECAVVEERCGTLAPSSDEASGSADGSGFGGPPSESGCDDTCPTSNDGDCDDGGPGADFPICGLGTDCTDCGPR